MARADTILFAEGFGLANVELRVPVSKDTVFRIGSITKEFTAAAVLLLVEDGRLKLDASICDYLPDYPEHARLITIKHLLQHTSGLVDFTRLPDYRRERALAISLPDVLLRFQQRPLEFQSGQKHRYSNSGYVLLAAIVEKVTGRPLNELIQQRIVDKLELGGTYCDDPARVIPNRASGYTIWAGRLRNAPFIHLKKSAGAGDMASTATDLVRWQRKLMMNRILRPETVKMMTARGRLKDGSPFNYGLGLRISQRVGKKVLSHGGGISGFRADLAYYVEEELTIAVVANNDKYDVAKLSNEIARQYFKVTVDAQPAPDSKKDARSE